MSDGIYCEISEFNEDVRTYHFKGPINNVPWGGVLALAIYQIEGVKVIYPAPYEIMVTKSCLYGWDDIEKEIIKRHLIITEQMEISKKEQKKTGV
jgi:hypothetical protein